METWALPPYNRPEHLVPDGEPDVVEIGGTVGDIENELFLESMRQMKEDVGRGNIVYIHLTYVPIPYGVNEQKSKPTQQSVNLLKQRGIFPDIIIGRCPEFLTREIKGKISNFCDVDPEAVWGTFVAFLRKKRARVTRSRRYVLERVLARNDHFLAEELVADMRTGTGRVSRGTVYRTLALMAEAGLVRKVFDQHLHVHYENAVATRRHGHLICSVCNRFVEFRDVVLAARLETVCRSHRFMPRAEASVSVIGVCDECRDRPGPDAHA